MDYKQQMEIFRKRRIRIKALFAQGMSAQVIADKLKIRRQRVYQILAMK